MVCFVDVENTMTEDYLRAHGIRLKISECEEGTFPLTVLRAKYDPKTETYENLSLEMVLNTVKVGSQKIFDLIVVDSVDAMVEQSQIEKTADENHRQGGIAKKLGEFLRKNTAKKATVIWLNQMRQGMSSMPGLPAPWIPSGGKALGFYASIRLELTMVGKLEEVNKPPYGFKTKVTLLKNKVGPRWRSTEINYINGVGFSTVYDYMNLALANGVITKSGSWFISDVLKLKVQGLLNLYRKIEANEEGSLDKLEELYSIKDTEVLINPEMPNEAIEKEQETLEVD
jgi:recombination protein RecA